MNKNKYTPEPWKVREFHGVVSGVIPDRTDEAMPYEVESGHSHGTRSWALHIATPEHGFAADAKSMGAANMQRIVACINACTGIEDPTGTIPALVKALRVAEVALMPAEDGAGDEVAWAVVREALAQVVARG